MGYHRSLREYIQILETRGKLFRIHREVCRETELHPLVRWQFRGLPESERRAFLFENVVGVTGHGYGMPVLAGACASSRASSSRSKRKSRRKAFTTSPFCALSTRN